MHAGLRAVIAAGGVLALLAAAVVLSSGTADACTSTPDPTVVDRLIVDGYQGEQLQNAAAIIAAAAPLGLDSRAPTIAVMTAMGESGLRNLDHGDTAGPDSRGLFQQRDNWGTLADRMNPITSATLFYAHLQAVPGWQTMTPAAAAHAVQRNADPDHYTPFYAAAADIVTALATVSGGHGCSNAAHADGDDYPWPDRPTITDGGGLSPLGYYYRECTDFVAWRLNRDTAHLTSPYAYRWSNLTPLGGNAIDWKHNWQSHDWPTSTTPQPGAIAWWGTRGGRLGHVAYVQAIHADGTVTIEEYNWGHTHHYGTRTILQTGPDLYLLAPA